MSIFAEKTLSITCGTGSFGNAVLKRFLNTDIGEIRIFSRDEKNKTICVKNTIAKSLSSISEMYVTKKA